MLYCTSNSDLKDNLSNTNPPRSQGVSRGGEELGEVSALCSAGATNLNVAMGSVAGVLPGASVIRLGGDCPIITNKCNA